MVSSRRAQIKNSFAENRLFTIRSVIAGVVAAVSCSQSQGASSICRC